MYTTYVNFKDQNYKQVENFGWIVTEKFYSFWLNEDHSKVLSIPVENVQYVEDKL